MPVNHWMLVGTVASRPKFGQKGTRDYVEWVLRAVRVVEHYTKIEEDYDMVAWSPRILHTMSVVKFGDLVVCSGSLRVDRTKSARGKASRHVRLQVSELEIVMNYDDRGLLNVANRYSSHQAVRELRAMVINERRLGRIRDV